MLNVRAFAFAFGLCLIITFGLRCYERYARPAVKKVPQPKFSGSWEKWPVYPTDGSWELYSSPEKKDWYNLVNAIATDELDSYSTSTINKLETSSAKKVPEWKTFVNTEFEALPGHLKQSKEFLHWQGLNNLTDYLNSPRRAEVDKVFANLVGCVDRSLAARMYMVLYRVVDVLQQQHPQSFKELASVDLPAIRTQLRQGKGSSLSFPETVLGLLSMNSGVEDGNIKRESFYNFLELLKYIRKDTPGLEESAKDFVGRHPKAIVSQAFQRHRQEFMTLGKNMKLDVEEPIRLMYLFAALKVDNPSLRSWWDIQRWYHNGHPDAAKGLPYFKTKRRQVLAGMKHELDQTVAPDGEAQQAWLAS